MSVQVVARTASPWYETNKFGSLGTLRIIFVLGTPPGVTKCGL